MATATMAPSGAAVVAPAVSPADLRAKLYASLTSAGVVDGLKTHLRSQLLSNLQATSPQVTHALPLVPHSHLISSTTRPSPAPCAPSQRVAFHPRIGPCTTMPPDVRWAIARASATMYRTMQVCTSWHGAPPAAPAVPECQTPGGC